MPILLLALLALWPALALRAAPSTAPAAATVPPANLSASVAADGRAIVIRFDRHAQGARATLIDTPRRILLDVPGLSRTTSVRIDGPVGGVRPQAIKGGTRLVFDLTRPAIVSDGGFDPDGRVLTLNLSAVDAGRFTQATRSGALSLIPFDLSFGNRPVAAPSVKANTPAGAATGSRVSRAIPPARAVPLPPVRGNRARPLVVIDAGHGGIDPGALNPAAGLREKDVTLRIARAIRDRLLAGKRVRVAMTRDDDRYLVLRERFGIARRLKADLFISIHCDSSGASGASGATVYTLSEVASDKEAARLAARENKADIINGVDFGDAGADVSSILIDLTRRETMNSSAAFARLLGREAKPLLPMKANFHRMASLMVLKAPDMPSILFETGYISNPADAMFLNSAAGRERIAESVRRAVEAHFARRLAGG